MARGWLASGNVSATGKSYRIPAADAKRLATNRAPPPQTQTTDREQEMTRSVIAVAVAAVALTACQPASGPPAAEVRLANKLIEAGVPIPIEGDAFQQIAFQQVQGMMAQDGLAPEQARQVLMGIAKNLEDKKPEIKEALVKAFTDEFNVKELELLVKFVTSKEGQAIQEKIQVVGQTGSEQFQAIAQEAGVKALADLRSAWPVPPPPAPAAPEATTPPGGAAAPATPPAGPAAPAKPN